MRVRLLSPGLQGIRRLFLYDDPSMENLRVEELAGFARTHVPGLEVESRKCFLPHLVGDSDQRISAVARALAEARLPPDPNGPLPMEVKVEERRLRNPERLVRGIIYDGLQVLGLMHGLLPADEALPGDVHVAFTSRLLGTLDPGGGRYHARVILCARHSIISTVGLVEGPARDREYYLTRSVEAALGATPGAAATALQCDGGGHEREGEEEGEGVGEGEGEGSERAWLEVDDPRLTEVAKGYLLQAVFHRVAESPFCADPRCRLFDAHTQRDMLGAQQGEPGLCGEHEAMLRGAWSR